jgi:hypothetical protein
MKPLSASGWSRRSLTIHGYLVGNQIACVDKAPRLNTQWRLVAKVAPEQIGLLPAVLRSYRRS